jgi:hypothetical protein
VTSGLLGAFPVKHPASARSRAIVAALTAAGFGVTIAVFYPGLMTYDARYVYGDIARGRYGDWQSPVMTWLWGLIDPILPGPASMFLLIVSLYWLGFAVLGMTIARDRPRLAPAVPLLALLPPAFLLIGVIWRDMLFAVCWLAAAALVYAVAGRRIAIRAPIQAAALVLFAIGVLLRPNALLAAPILGFYLAFPRRFAWKRAVLGYVPTGFALFAMVQVVYYGVMGAERQHPLHSLIVYDLGGITHFSGENQFPVDWTPEQTRLLTSTCYTPQLWDVYWYREPCKFVMDRIEKQERLFGTTALTRAWLNAVMAHPLAYVAHRSAVFWRFLAGDNLVVWFQDLDDPEKVVRDDDRALMWLKAVHDALKPTPLLRTGVWLGLTLTLAAAAWRRRDTPAGAFVLGTCGSGALYLMSYWLVGVSSDFRYGYWAVLAALAGAAVLAGAPIRRDPDVA